MVIDLKTEKKNHLRILLFKLKNYTVVVNGRVSGIMKFFIKSIIFLSNQFFKIKVGLIIKKGFSFFQKMHQEV